MTVSSVRAMRRHFRKEARRRTRRYPGTRQGHVKDKGAGGVLSLRLLCSLRENEGKLLVTLATFLEECDSDQGCARSKIFQPRFEIRDFSVGFKNRDSRFRDLGAHKAEIRDFWAAPWFQIQSNPNFQLKAIKKDKVPLLTAHFLEICTANSTTKISVSSRFLGLQTEIRDFEISVRKNRDSRSRFEISHGSDGNAKTRKPINCYLLE